MIGSQSFFVVDAVDIPDYSLVTPCENVTQYTVIPCPGYDIAGEVRMNIM
jgi:hypothetical protein